MAQPTNTYDTYDMVGIREDLKDVIFNIDPDETPFLTSCGKMSASNTLVEWQTDALRASATNAHIEGDDTTADSRSPTVRLGNYTQIFKNAVITSGTEAAVTKAGRATEMAYQSRKSLKEQKLDIEKALFANQAKVAGNSTTARQLAGAPAWVTTNVVNIGTGGANPTGDGSDARTDGTQTALAQADFDSLMQDIWTNGGRARKKTVYLSPYQMNVALGFTGNNNQRNNVSNTEVSNTMDVYTTPWGQVVWTPSLENRTRDVFVMQDDMWAVATLRPTKNESLAKTGDNEKRQIVTELTLICKNEAASGLVADCSTS